MSGIMAEPLATVINNYFTQDLFPKNAKESLDKL